MSELSISKWQGEKADELYAIVRQSKSANLAHLLEWQDVFARAYGHTPVCFIARRNEQCVGMIPAFLIQRPILGAVMTSMPFLDYGGPCADAEDVAEALVQALVNEAREKKCKHVEVRSLQSLPFSSPENLDKVTMILELNRDPEILWKNLNAKVRNQVRKAQKNDLTVEIGGNEYLAEFYNIWSANMRDLGSPPHSIVFFREILNAFKGNAFIAVVRTPEKIIGGLVAIKHGETVVVPWASSLREYFKFCPNMLLYWEVIHRACEEGFKRFDFGRSTRDVGTYKFKKQWGAQEQQLYWYTIPLNSEQSGLSGTSKNGHLAVEIWKRLPLCVSNMVGPKLRKYLTQ